MNLMPQAKLCRHMLSCRCFQGCTCCKRARRTTTTAAAAPGTGAGGGARRKVPYNPPLVGVTSTTTIAVRPGPTSSLAGSGGTGVVASAAGEDFTKKPPLSSYISGFVLVSFGLRVWWFVAKATLTYATFGQRLTMFALNRLAMISLFSGFSLIVFDWANVWSVAHGTNPRTPYYLCVALNVFIIVTQAFACMDLQAAAASCFASACYYPSLLICTPLSSLMAAALLLCVWCQVRRVCSIPICSPITPPPSTTQSMQW